MKSTYILIIYIFLYNTLSYSQAIPDYIVIPAGCMHSGCVWHPGFNFKLQENVNRVATLWTSFGTDCYYKSTKTGWNKLYRIDKKLAHLDRSLRLGWRTNQKTMIFEIGLYAHIHGKIESLALDYSPELGLLNINKYQLIMQYKGMFARAGDNSYCIKRKIFEANTWYGTGVAQGAFFGDPEKAPHIMQMFVSNVYWDVYDGYWDNGPNKGFGNSIFYSDDKYNVYASNSITAPILDTHSASMYTTIENGADIIFYASNKIILKKGFHVQSGAHFRAIIASDKSSLDTISDLFLVNEAEINKLFLDNQDNKKSDLKTEILNSKDEYLQIYPNPNPGIFTLEVNLPNTPVYEVEIINQMGKTIYKKQNISMGKTAIDISAQPQGVYFVKITSGIKTYTKKMVYQ